MRARCNEDAETTQEHAWEQMSDRPDADDARPGEAIVKSSMVAEQRRDKTETEEQKRHTPADVRRIAPAASTGVPSSATTQVPTAILPIV